MSFENKRKEMTAVKGVAKRRVELYPDMDIKGDRHLVDLYAEDDSVLRIQTAEFSDRPELGEGDILVQTPLFKAVVCQNQQGNAWLIFVRMGVLRLKIIESIVEIISDISDIDYHLNPEGRPGDESPWKGGTNAHAQGN